MIPKWHRELSIFYQIKSGIILEGNINDIYTFPEQGSELFGVSMRLTQYLHYFFKARGYGVIVQYDVMTHGFTAPDDPASLSRFAQITNVPPETREGVACVSAALTTANNNAPDVAARALKQTEIATVIIMDMASRYIVSPDGLKINEVWALARLQKGIAEAGMGKGTNGQRARNLIVLITNKQNDLPAWFFLENPSVKTLNIGHPTADERRAMLSGDRLRSFFAADVYSAQRSAFSAGDLEKLVDRFVARTEGFSAYEMNNLRNLCRNMKIHLRDLVSVVDLYTYGIRDNPWQSEAMYARVGKAEAIIRARVKGQDAALRQTLDVIKRSVVGMSDTRGTSAKPKGVLFFAGPTGTGKTETAKALAEVIFGDETACVRFDMSEYSQAHSDQRLMGAPPGYVGYEAGGQLTNAIRQNPFRILLFDEIEKAAPSIMDKFLQILEDGRMTDGQGNTVYFSECVIIFTSNLGITVEDQTGRRVENVRISDPYSAVQKKVREAIEDHFKLKLGRPEILNRIGENIVVFDFIRETVARQILAMRMEEVRAMLSESKHIALSWDAALENALAALVMGNLKNGGRGVGNVVEYAWRNPLARLIFDRGLRGGARIHVSAIRAERTPVELDCKVLTQ